MDNIREIAAQLNADRRDAWKRMSFGERLLSGAELFDVGIMMMRTGIRMQHPDANDEQVNEMVRARLRRADRLQSWRDKVASGHHSSH